eukprot:scaffold32972_cov28-Tisochrysis_lutea.AAC.1
MEAARAITVGKFMTSAAPTGRPVRLLSSRATITAFSELPPNSKKSESMRTSSAFTRIATPKASRTCRTTVELVVALAAVGGMACSSAAPISTGEGRRFLSIFPPLVRGHSVTPMTNEGSIYWANRCGVLLSDAHEVGWAHIRYESLVLLVEQHNCVHNSWLFSNGVLNLAQLDA